MSNIKRLDMSLTRLGAAGLIVASWAAAPAYASDSDAMSWVRFGGQSYEASTQSYNQSFVRQWEANPPRGYPTISRSNIEPTKAAIKRYAAIVKRGGWRSIGKLPEDEETLEVGLSHNLVGQLHDRLLSSGELRSPSNFPRYFDYTLEKAVKRFQASNGLTPTGIVDDRTRRALNIPAKVRLRQLRVNLNRLRAHAKSGKRRYVVVNIPAAQIESVEGDRVVSRHTGVVGKIDRRTPVLSSAIHELNFNPVWRLPPTVIKKDLIPKGRQMQRAKKNVLLKYGIDAYSGNGRKLDPKKINWNSSQPYNLSYRQQPGRDNPLGFVKINFHNSHSVYLHDTPSDRLFGRNFRAASSGCVRVSNIETLLTWLLKDKEGYGRSAIDDLKESGETKTVRMRRNVPIHMVYITAWATEDGVVQFRRDLYRRDGVGAVASAY